MSGMHRTRSIFYLKSRGSFSGESTVFFIRFFFSVTDFVFILLKLVLGMFCSVGFSRVDCGMDMVVFLDR